uniref:ABC-type nitrate/sulfonate/bicarbonate transport system, periplasmic component n=1 Tax=Eubacterium cellulosolvens (strain ATCC 43171 / JCM 9499 / 6) TaxID=633697 RepID=I5AWZ1_EUBC6
MKREIILKSKAGILSIIVCMALTVFAGCGNAGQKESGVAASASAAEQGKSLTVGVMQVADSAVLYTAEKEKLFEKEGLAVELVEFGSASELSKAFEAGGVDIVMTDMIVEGLLRKGGKNTKTIRTALGETAEEGRFIIAASPNSKVETPEDLKGANVAISENTGMEYQVDSYLKELGIDENDIHKVSIPSLSLRYETMMEGKDVDAAILPDPLGLMAEKNGAKTVIDDTKLKQNVSITVIVADEHLISKNREAVELFCSAYDEAARMLNDRPEDYRQLVLEKANVPENLKESYEVPGYAVNTVPKSEEVDDVVTWLKKKGLIDTVYGYDDLVDPTFITGES